MNRRLIVPMTAVALFIAGFYLANQSAEETASVRSFHDGGTDVSLHSVPPNHPSSPEAELRSAFSEARRPFDAREMTRLHRATPLPDLMNDALVSLWKETAPAEVMAWIDRVQAWPRGDENESREAIVSELFEAWAARDANAALIAARAMEPPGCKAAALKSVISAVRKSDPETAVQALLEWQSLDPVYGDPLYAEPRSPANEMELLRCLPPSPARARLKSDVMLAAMDKQAAEASAVWAAASREERIEMVRGGFMPAEKHHSEESGDGTAAPALFPGAFALAKTAVEAAGPREREGAAHAFWQGSGREWAACDFPAAMEWLKQNSTPLEFHWRLGLIAGHAARTQASNILAAVPNLESLAQKVAVLSAVAGACPPELRDNLATLVAGLPPESQQMIKPALSDTQRQ